MNTEATAQGYPLEALLPDATVELGEILLITRCRGFSELPFVANPAYPLDPLKSSPLDQAVPVQLGVSF